MLGSKVFEIKVKKIETLSGLWTKGDQKIRQFYDWLIFKYNRYKKISHIFIFDFLPSYAYEVTVKLKDYIAKKYYQAGDKFRGRRILRDRGSVSSFLQHISENKSNTTNL